jgi:hypothetical protein
MNRKAIVIGFTHNAVVAWVIGLKRKTEKTYYALKGYDQKIAYLPANLVDRETVNVGTFVYWQTARSEFGDVKVNLIRRGYDYEAGIHYRVQAEHRVMIEHVGVLRCC